MTFGNISSTATALAINNVTNQNTTFTFTTAAVAGAADSATVTLNNVLNTDGTNATGDLTLAGIETVNLVSESGPNSIETLVAANATKLVVSGSQSLNIGDVLGATVTVVDGTAAAGGLTVTLGAANNATVDGGAGNDSFTVSNVVTNTVLTGGAGNDTVTATTAANFGTEDTVSGGDGTDTIVLAVADAEGGYNASALTTRTLTGFEVLSVAQATGNGAITTANIDTSINTVSLTGGYTAGTYAITGPASSLTVNVGGAGGAADRLAGQLTLTDTGTGITDQAFLVNTDTANTTGNVFNGQAVVSTGYETLTINTKGGTNSTNTTAQTLGTVTINQDSGGTGVLKFVGANGITTGAITANEVDASGLTGAATFRTGGAAISATKITGSAGAAGDNITTSATSTSVDGGAGNDTIVAGAGNDTLKGGEGLDAITAGAGNDSIDAGAGNDTVTFAATADFNANDTLVGGDGTDTLTTTIGAQTALTAALTNVSGFETLNISDAGGLAGATLNMARLANSGINKIELVGAAGTSTISNLAAATTIEQQAANAAATLTVTGATDTATDAITLRLNAANTANFGTVTATAFESFTINSTTTNAAPAGVTNTLVLGTTNGTGVTVSGNTALVLTTSAAAVNVASINASSMTAGGVNASNANATVASTLTGSAFADTLLGGGGNDTIDGGDSADSLVGGSGMDSITGGAGNDTLDGGAGNDTLLGGDGNDNFVTSGGTDSIDGGSGNDTLTLSAAFNNLANATLTSVETLDMASNGGTMTIAALNGFTTVNNAGAVTLSDAGTINAGTTVTTYNLANGTNTFNANTIQALNMNVTGGTGADTFNFSSANFDANDILVGGTGTDTVNLSGNTAMTITFAAGVTGLEQINIANTTTDVSFTTNEANVVAGQTLGIDASSLTSGRLTFNGVNETTGATASFNVVGGNAADTITGGSGADTVNGGSGADVIVGGAGADNITAGEGTDTVTIGDGQDTVSLTEATPVADTLIWSTAFAGGNANAATVSGFAFGAGADLIDINVAVLNGTTNIAAGTGATNTLAALAPVAVASNGTATANDVIFTFNGAGDLLAAGTTVANAVANAVTALTSGTDFSSASIATGDSLILQMNDGTNTFVFHYVADGTPATTVAADLTLIGMFSGTTVQALTGDFI